MKQERDSFYKLKRHNKGAIEEYFHTYKLIKNQIKEMEAEIAEGNTTIGFSEIHNKTSGNPTEKKAILISSLKELTILRNIVKAIEDIRPRLKKEALIVYEEYLINKTDYRIVCKKANIEKSSLYRYADIIIQMVAEELKMLA